MILQANICDLYSIVYKGVDSNHDPINFIGGVEKMDTKFGRKLGVLVGSAGTSNLFVYLRVTTPARVHICRCDEIEM